MKFGFTRELRKRRPRRISDVLERAPVDQDEMFDLERDVSRTLVERYVLKPDLWEGNTQAGLMITAAAMMYPDILEHFRKDMITKQKMYEEMREKYTLFKRDETVFTVAEVAMGLHMLYPDDRDEESEMKRELREWFVSSLTRFREKKFWYAWCILAMALAVIYPETREELQINEDAWNGSKEYLEEHRNDAHQYIPMIAKLKFLFPEKAEELQAPREDWETFKTLIERQKIIHSSYIEYARDAYMASVHRYEITPDGGIVVTPHPPKMSKSDPIPPRSNL